MNNSIPEIMQELFITEYGHGRKPTLRQNFRRRKIVRGK